MRTYEEKIRDEVMAWKRKITKPTGWFRRLANKSQAKMNALIPEKAHVVITASIKKMVQAVLTGAEFTTKKRDVGNLSLEAKDEMLQQAINTYKKMAAAEGAGTGAGGLYWDSPIFRCCSPSSLSFCLRRLPFMGST